MKKKSGQDGVASNEHNSMFKDVAGGELRLVSQIDPQGPWVGVVSKKDGDPNVTAWPTVAVALDDDGNVRIQIRTKTKAKISVTMLKK